MMIIRSPEILILDLQKVPAMEDGDLRLFESGAILLHLASKKGDLTQSQASRLAAWTLFANSTMATAFFSPNRSQMNPLLETLNDLLTKSPYLEDGKFSMSDVAVGSYLLYLPLFYPEMFPAFCKQFPAVWTYMKTLAARPQCPDAYKEAIGSVSSQSNPLADIFKKRG